MKVSWIKGKNEAKSFRFFQNMGFDVYEMEDLEQVDSQIEKLVENHCHTIILSSEAAGFSEDIIRKYDKDESVNIIIAPNKEE